MLRYTDADGAPFSVVAARAGLTQQHIGQVARELSRLGYVSITHAEHDGRARIVRLTERGCAARDAAAAAAAEVEQEWEGRYGLCEIRSLRAALEAIVADATPEGPA